MSCLSYTPTAGWLDLFVVTLSPRPGRTKQPRWHSTHHCGRMRPCTSLYRPQPGSDTRHFCSQLIHWPELVTWEVHLPGRERTGYLASSSNYHSASQSLYYLHNHYRKYYYYPYINDEQTDAQRSKATSPKSHS